MRKNFVGGFDCSVWPHPGCGPDSTYARIKLCEEQFWSFIAWPFFWSLEYCAHSAKLALIKAKY